MRVADTSFLIALFDEDDPRRARAMRWASDPEPIEVPSEVLAETLGVLHRRAGYAKAASVWQDLCGLPHVVFSETSDTEAAADEFLRARGKLSWVDAAVVARCRAEEAHPLCFDQAIARALARRR